MEKELTLYEQKQLDALTLEYLMKITAHPAESGTQTYVTLYDDGVMNKFLNWAEKEGVFASKIKVMMIGLTIMHSRTKCIPIIENFI